MKFAAAYAALAVIVAVSSLTFAQLVSAPAKSPLERYAPCYAVPQLGPNVVVCRGNLHAYHLQEAGPVDMGSLPPAQPGIGYSG